MSAQTQRARQDAHLVVRYREAIKRLTAKKTGLCLDETCPNCGHPEMSVQCEWPSGEPLGVAICRQCGHAELTG